MNLIACLLLYAQQSPCRVMTSTIQLQSWNILWIKRYSWIPCGGSKCLNLYTGLYYSTVSIQDILEPQRRAVTANLDSIWKTLWGCALRMENLHIESLAPEQLVYASCTLSHSEWVWELYKFFTSIDKFHRFTIPSEMPHNILNVPLSAISMIC